MSTPSLMGNRVLNRSTSHARLELFMRHVGKSDMRHAVIVPLHVNDPDNSWHSVILRFAVANLLGFPIIQTAKIFMQGNVLKRFSAQMQMYMRR